MLFENKPRLMRSSRSVRQAASLSPPMFLTAKSRRVISLIMIMIEKVPYSHEMYFYNISRGCSLRSLSPSARERKPAPWRDSLNRSLETARQEGQIAPHPRQCNGAFRYCSATAALASLRTSLPDHGFAVNRTPSGTNVILQLICVPRDASTM